MDLIIIGASSNICKLRVFNNLNMMHEKINNIYCCSSRDYTQDLWIEYVNNLLECKNITNNITNKITFIKCKYNIQSYTEQLSQIINNNTIIYVCVPPVCYKEIIFFFNTIKKGKLVLEKPLSLNYEEFTQIQPLLNEHNMIIDHFVYKKDVQKIIEKYSNNNPNNNQQIKKIAFKFLYTDDVEDRLGYFDKSGFFIDMFQSHFLSIIYLLLGHKMDNLLKSKIKIDRRQYKNYGGLNKEADTYFYLTIKAEDIIINCEAGKAMNKSIKEITINNNIHTIKNYEDEYFLFFSNIEKHTNLISKQLLFWKITNKIEKQFTKMKYYDKNKQFI